MQFYRASIKDGWGLDWRMRCKFDAISISKHCKCIENDIFCIFRVKKIGFVKKKKTFQFKRFVYIKGPIQIMWIILSNNILSTVDRIAEMADKSSLLLWLIASSFAVCVMCAEDHPCVVNVYNNYDKYDKRLENVSGKDIHKSDVVTIFASKDLVSRVCATVRFEDENEECDIMDYKTSTTHKVKVSCHSHVES